ncbi:MAG: hypothetical protein IKW45_09895 [Clostridia bacterium]|nr:hypothetical protein [Clostridia bacterium]
MLKQNQKHNKGILSYIAMIWLLYVADSMLFSLNNNGSVMRIAQLSQLVAGFILLFFIIKKNISTDFLALIVVSCSVLLTGILINGTLYIALRKIAVFIVGYYVARCANTKKVIDIYCDIMLFIAIISLIAFSIPDTAISISFPPRIITSTRESEFVTLFFTNIPTESWNQTRNWGPFWEPGAYQAFLNIALIFTLFLRNIRTKYRIFSAIIFIITIISTLSTTGYLALFFIFLAYIFSNKNSNLFATLGKLVLICVFFIGVIYIVFFSGLFETVVIKKLENENTARYQFIIYGLKAFLESPLIGNGAKLSSVITDINGSDISRTNTFVAMFAIFGTIPGFYTVIRYFKTFANFKKSTTIVSTIFIGFAICCLLFGEYFIYSPIFAWLMYLRPIEYTNKTYKKE